MSINDLLFATPWWIIVPLIGGGGWIFFIGNARLDRTVKWLGIATILVGVTLMILSRLVETDKERVERESRQIVQSFVDRDWPRLHALLAPETSIPGIYNNRDALINGAKKTVDAIGLKSAPITSFAITQNDTVMTVNLSILSTQDSTFDRPYPSNWQFDWEDHGTGWLLERIEPQDSTQVSREQLSGHMSR